jgi:hypothetical protein
MKTLPAFIAGGEGGGGFAEIAQTLLAGPGAVKGG